MAKSKNKKARAKKKRAAKQAAMHNPGGKSRYATKKRQANRPLAVT
jgi:hypothetical protein